MNLSFIFLLIGVLGFILTAFFLIAFFLIAFASLALQISILVNRNKKTHLWNFASLLGFCLVMQIITGVTLAMHYNPSVLEAFNSVEHIMRDVNDGWLIRYLYSNTASGFIFLVYLHIGRSLYYGSYRAPEALVWTIGTVIFILMMATAFLGYVLPYNLISIWGLRAISEFISCIPWIGQGTLEFISEGFSANKYSLNMFCALFFVSPFVIAALALMHWISLHDSAGSGNPLGVSGNYDRLALTPDSIFKKWITIFIFIGVLFSFVFGIHMLILVIMLFILRLMYTYDECTNIILSYFILIVLLLSGLLAFIIFHGLLSDPIFCDVNYNFLYEKILIMHSQYYNGSFSIHRPSMFVWDLREPFSPYYAQLLQRDQWLIHEASLRVPAPMSNHPLGHCLYIDRDTPTPLMLEIQKLAFRSRL